MAIYGPEFVGGARRGNWLRRRILFHVLAYLIVVGILVTINAVLGGAWWSLGIALVWGGFLFLRFVVMAVLWHFMRPKGPVGPRWRGRMMQ